MVLLDIKQGCSLISLEYTAEEFFVAPQLAKDP